MMLRPNASKLQQQADSEALVAEYLKNGGKITVMRGRKTFKSRYAVKTFKR